MRKGRQKRKSIRDMKEGLRRRVEESYKNRGSFRRGIFREDLPEGVLFWKCGEGEHLIDVVPYIAGPNDPLTKEGDPTYVLELRVHQGVGPAEGQDFVCLAENYGKPCPICEHRRQLRAEGADDEVWKALYPKRRAVYNVICYDSAEEEDKGIQVWEVAWWFAERLFVELAKGPSVGSHRRGGKEVGFVPFADPDEGKSIAFTRQGSGARNTQYLGHRFVERDYEIPDELLEAAWVLDELIYIPTYEEVYDAYWGEGSAPEEEPGELEEEQELIGEEEPEEEEPAEEKPRRVRGRKISKPEPEVEEEQDQEPENSDEEECPGGGVFGVDTDELEHCEECEVWEQCVEEYDRREKEKQKARASRRRRK